MIAAPANRIKQYIEQPNASIQYGSVVMAALATMHRLMNSLDNDLAFQAANAILEIEKTRLRHKTPVAGTEPAPVVQPDDVARPSWPSSSSTGETPVPPERFESAVDEIVVTLNQIQTAKGEPEFPREVLREQYQQKADEMGFEQFLTWHDRMMGRSTTTPGTAPAPGRRAARTDSTHHSNLCTA
jgi:hypothetical protein